MCCAVADGDPLGQFAIIQEEEGEWGLILKEPLDREARDRYTLQITATDGKFQSLATAEVHVLDVNDNSPVCHQVSSDMQIVYSLQMINSLNVSWLRGGRCSRSHRDMLSCSAGNWPAVHSS